MRPHAVESFVVDAIKDEPLPSEIPGFKPGAAFIRKVLEQCPSVISIEEGGRSGQDPLPFSDLDPFAIDEEQVQLRQPTIYHGRSFELEHSLLAEPWQDEFGNSYSSISLKGNNYSEPSVIETLTASDRVIAYGLQESSVIRRVLRASRILRTNGIGTEYIVGIAEPKELPWPTIDRFAGLYEMVSLPEYKRRIVERHWEELPDEQRTSEALVDLSSRFERMVFYTSARAMDTAYRLGDIRRDDEALEAFVTHLNKHEPSAKEQPYTSSKKDMSRYIHEIFIPRAASNLAKLHSLGLAHRYPNGMNVTALGSIVDLDSVHGQLLELGDEPITYRDMANDLVTFMNDLGSFSGRRGELFMEDEVMDEFAKAYFDFSEQLAGSTMSGNLHAAKIVMATEDILRHNSYDEDHTWPRPGILQDAINSSFISRISEASLIESEDRFDGWVRDVLPTLKPKFYDQLRADLPRYVAFLYDGFINEVRRPDFDLVEASLEDPHNMGTTLEWMVEAANELAEEEFYKNLDTRIEDGTQSAEALLNNAISVAQRLRRRLEFDKWSYDFILEALPTFEDRFREVCQILPFDSVLSGDASRSLPVFHTGPNTLLMETAGVLINEIADLLDRTTDELVIEPIEIENGDLHFEYNVTKDGSVLIEILSADMFDGMSSDYEVTVSQIDCPNPIGEYVMFVERKPDGSKRLRLFLKNGEIAKQMNSQNRNSDILRYSFVHQGRLF